MFENINKLFCSKYGSLLYLLIIFIGVVFLYQSLPSSYFEQDEWHTFAYYNYLLTLEIGELVQTIFENATSHFTPLSLFFKLGLYSLFGLNAFPYFLIGIILHTLVAFTLFFLLLRVTENKITSLVGALFFAVNSSHYQAVTWIGTFEGTLLSTLLGGLSILWIFIHKVEGKKMVFYIPSMLLIIGMFFKETVLTFLPALLILVFWVNKEFKIRIINSLIVIFPIFLYFLFRILVVPNGEETYVSKIGSLRNVYLYNVVSTPIKTITQVIFPNEFLVVASKFTADWIRNQDLIQLSGPWFSFEAAGYDFIVFGIGLLILVIIVFLAKRVTGCILVGMGGTILFFTFLPLLPLNKYLVFLDSRYLYPATFGFGLILGTLLTSTFKRSRKKLLYLFLVLIIVLLFSHVFVLRLTVNSHVKIGTQRREIVDKIILENRNLPSKTIFYTESDATYYGMPEDERILPFQSGLGELLLVRYYKLAHIPVEYFKNDFLWQIDEQGYKEINGSGFGYFRSFENLANTIAENKVALDSIISYRYDSDDGSLTSISEEIRGRLRGYFSYKKRVGNDEFVLSATLNPTDVNYAKDGDRTTSWNSGLAYAFPQSIQIALSNTKMISQIRLDSYLNKNQTQTGYSVLFSINEEDWKEVFYSKRHTPNKEGYTDLFIDPQLARFIRIEQKGYHQYADWSINEIEIYETSN